MVLNTAQALQTGFESQPVYSKVYSACFLASFFMYFVGFSDDKISFQYAFFTS
jgi:hypothetical protein